MKSSDKKMICVSPFVLLNSNLRMEQNAFKGIPCELRDLLNTCITDNSALSWSKLSEYLLKSSVNDPDFVLCEDSKYGHKGTALTASLVNMIEEYASQRGTIKAVSDNAASHFFGDELCEDDCSSFIEDAFKTSFYGYEGSCAVLCAALLFYITDNSTCRCISNLFKDSDLNLCLKVMYLLSRRFFKGANLKTFTENSYFMRNLKKAASIKNKENAKENAIENDKENNNDKDVSDCKEPDSLHVMKHHNEKDFNDRFDFSTNKDLILENTEPDISIAGEMDRLVFGDSPVREFSDAVDTLRNLIDNRAPFSEIRDHLSTVSLKLKNESKALRHQACRDDLKVLRIIRDLLRTDYVFNRGAADDESSLEALYSRMAVKGCLKSIRELPYVRKYICIAFLNSSFEPPSGFFDNKFLSKNKDESGCRTFDEYIESLELNSLYFEDPELYETVTKYGERSLAQWIADSIYSLEHCNSELTDLLRHENGLDDYCTLELENYIIEKPALRGLDDECIHYDEDKLTDDSKVRIKEALNSLAALIRSRFMPYDALSSLPYVKLVTFMMERGFSSQEIDLPLKALNQKVSGQSGQSGQFKKSGRNRAVKDPAPVSFEKSFAFMFGNRKLPEWFSNPEKIKLTGYDLNLMKSCEKSARLKRIALIGTFDQIESVIREAGFYDFTDDLCLVADFMETVINKRESSFQFVYGSGESALKYDHSGEELSENGKQQKFCSIYYGPCCRFETAVTCLFESLRIRYSGMDFGHLKNTDTEKRRICDFYMRNQRFLRFICLDQRNIRGRKTQLPLPEECLKIALILKEADRIIHLSKEELDRTTQNSTTQKGGAVGFTKNRLIKALVEDLPDVSGKTHLLKMLSSIGFVYEDLPESFIPEEDVPSSLKRLFWQSKLYILERHSLNSRKDDSRAESEKLKALINKERNRLWQLNRYEFSCDLNIGSDRETDFWDPEKRSAENDEPSSCIYRLIQTGCYERLLYTAGNYFSECKTCFYSSENGADTVMLPDHCDGAVDYLSYSGQLRLYSRFKSLILPSRDYLIKPAPSNAGKVLTRLERRLRERGIKTDITPRSQGTYNAQKNPGSQKKDFLKIAGNRKLTEFLNENYVLPYMEAKNNNDKLKEKFFSRFLLISGQSGTGKTYAVNALARKLDLKVKKYDVTALSSHYVHGVNEKFKEIAADLLLQEPVIALFENFEEILRDRRFLKADNDWTGEEVSAFANSMDELKAHNILLVMTVTDRKLLDSGISEKFSCEIELTDPDDDDICDLLNHELNKDIFSEEQIAYLVKSLNGRSIRQITGFLEKLKKSVSDSGFSKADYELIDEELNRFDGLTLPKDAVFRLPGQKAFEKFINENLISLAKNPAAYRKFESKPIDPLLLFGPPGTGKTYAVKALSDFIHWKMYTVDASQFGEYTSGASRRVNEIFKKARETAPSIIVIDEADAFFRKRESGRSNEMISEFLRSINNTARDRVMVIATTNLVGDIDEAILRNGRFSNVIEIGYADSHSAFEVLKKGFSKVPLSENSDLEKISELLAGRPICDVQAVVEKSRSIAAFKNVSCITDEIIKDALSKVRDSRTAQKSCRRIGFI